jgi:hypothetical protein
LKQEVVPMRGRKQQNVFIQKNLKNTRNELIVHWTTDIKKEKEIRSMTKEKVLNELEQVMSFMYRELNPNSRRDSRIRNVQACRSTKLFD